MPHVIALVPYKLFKSKFTCPSQRYPLLTKKQICLALTRAILQGLCNNLKKSMDYPNPVSIKKFLSHLFRRAASVFRRFLSLRRTPQLSMVPHHLPNVLFGHK